MNGTLVKLKFLTDKGLLKMNNFEVGFVSGIRKIYNSHLAIATSSLSIFSKC